MNVESVPGRLPERRWDIDWLRMLVVIGMLVPFHVFRLFDTRDPFYVKNTPQSTALNWYLILGDTIGMQLLFMLAGGAAWYSLRRARAVRFAWLRVKRLLVPFLVGLVVVIPPQLYAGARFHGFSGSFLDWLPTYLTFDPEAVGSYEGIGWSPAHLWFILYLLIISLAALPILVLLRTGAGRRLLGLVAAARVVGAVLIVPALLALTLYLMFDFEPNPLYYLVWFLAGYGMLAEPRLEEVTGRIKGPALAVGVIGLVLNILWQADVPALQFISGLIAEGARKTIIAWLIIVGLLGYARAYASEAPRSRRTLAAVAYLGEASYPFYILHQTVIVVLGYFVVRWPWSVTAKYLLLVPLTYVVTLGLYDVFVRRTNATRFLFGMRPLSPREKARVAVA